MSDSWRAASYNSPVTCTGLLHCNCVVNQLTNICEMFPLLDAGSFFSWINSCVALTAVKLDWGFEKSWNSSCSYLMEIRVHQMVGFRKFHLGQHCLRNLRFFHRKGTHKPRENEKRKAILFELPVGSFLPRVQSSKTIHCIGGNDPAKNKQTKIKAAQSICLKYISTGFFKSDWRKNYPYSPIYNMFTS